MSEPIYNSAGEVLYPGLAGDGAGYRGSRLVILTPESWEKSRGSLAPDAGRTGAGSKDRLCGSRLLPGQLRCSGAGSGMPGLLRGAGWLVRFTPGRSPPETSGCR